MQEKWETAPYRAWRDTKKWLLSSFIAWIIVAAILGVISAIFIPANNMIIYRAIYGAIGAFVGLILIISITYLLHLPIALYRQRNEVRAKLIQKPTTPLRNRNRLIEVLGEAKIATIELIERERKFRTLYEQNPSMINDSILREVNKNVITGLNDARNRYKMAFESVEKEKLVAGQDYEDLINPLVLFMQSGVSFVNIPLDKGESNLLTFKNHLEKSLRETIRRIDEISHQAPHN